MGVHSFLVAIALMVVGCAPLAPLSAGTPTPAGPPPLVLSGIPDQNAAMLDQMFSLMSGYLARSTGLEVKYAPSSDYAAIVTAFKRGDVHLAWFGGLTGVQAQAQLPGTKAIAQRPRDAEFRSVFVVGSEVRAQELRDLRGLTFTFGSESSTSGHLMPRYFLLQAGVDATRDFKGAPGFSGSHDKTYKLVETGAYQAGALNEAVWETAIRTRTVDTSRLRVLQVTPPYYDYHWSVRPDMDRVFGAGAEHRIITALLDLRANMGEDESRLLDLFSTDRFIPTDNRNYRAIEEVAAGLGVIR